MFSHIMVPLDTTESAETAIPPAIAMARAHGATMHLVLVTELSGTDAAFDELLESDHRQYAEGKMHPLAARLQVALGTLVRVAHLTGTGSVAHAMAEYAKTNDVDLVVMTTHGRTGLRRAWSGSVADQLTHLIAAPVLLLRRQGRSAEAPLGLFWRMLVALDGSEAAEAVLDPVLALDVHRKAKVILGRVVGPVPLELPESPGVVLTDAAATQAAVDEARRYLESLAVDLQVRAGLEVDTVVELEPTGFPMVPTASTVAHLALRERADLVALITHQRGASRLLFASVADYLLRETSCALLVCHGAGVTAFSRSSPELSRSIVPARSGG
jgi:nucleotide-binding universal stress UspA family protein